MKISHGKNTFIMSESTYGILNDCLKNFKSESDVISGNCRPLVIPKLFPKFLILNLKSSEVEVKSELMIHDPSECKYLTVYTFWC